MVTLTQRKRRKAAEQKIAGAQDAAKVEGGPRKSASRQTSAKRSSGGQSNIKMCSSEK